MRAIILAAGLGLRLQQSPGEQFPKCLLRFDGVSLLERHLRLLGAAGIDDIVIAVGFEPHKVEAEVARLGLKRAPEIVLNPRYDLGSVLTVHTVADALTRGGDVLLMDADVLYDERILDALVQGEHANRLLIDRDYEAGDEPVKLCLKHGVPVELRKQLAVGLDYDTIGESVGFFRFREETAKRFAEIVAGYVDGFDDGVDGGSENVSPRSRANLPHEEAVRDLLLERRFTFETADVTHAPWIEIDFPNDVARASEVILPQLARPVGALR